MERYINQLINDIREASWNIKPPSDLWIQSEADPDDDLELEDISYAEKYIYGEEIPIEEITGIKCELLPGPSKLTEQQKAVLSEELEKLLENFHFVLDFPENFPMHLRYSFIRMFWLGSHVPLSFGESHIEFCDLNEEECPFPGYCTTCKEVAEQMKIDEEMEGDIEDFDFSIEKLLPSKEDLDRFFQFQEELSNSENDTDQNEDQFYSRIYDEAGNRIPHESIPLNGLCAICKLYTKDKSKEDIFCQQTRYDQRGSSQRFNCKSFVNRDMPF